MWLARESAGESADHGEPAPLLHAGALRDVSHQSGDAREVYLSVVLQEGAAGMSKAIQAEVDAFTRSLLADRLAQCSPAQQALFHRFYPGEVPEHKLINAIDLCDRTIKKNLENPKRLEGQQT